MAEPSLFMPPQGSRKRFRDEIDEGEEERKHDIKTADDADDKDLIDLLDDSDGEDDGENTGPCQYHEGSEPLPSCVAYDPEFQLIKNDLSGIAGRISKVLELSLCCNQRVERGLEEAAQMASVAQTKRQKIALLGNTGSGKSSLLNSLLGMPTLANVMASGQSCTYVGTEYEGPFQGQRKKFAAKVEYFDFEAIQQLLKKLLSDYYTWRFENADDWTEEVKQENNRLFATAINTFKALFCNQAEFMSARHGESAQPGENFLNIHHNDSAGALQKMCDWCQELLEEKEADEQDCTEYMDGDTQKELVDQLDPLVTTNPDSAQPKLWPLVKKVRIGIDGPRILDFIVIVDLPGLDDTNRVRVNASLEIMRSCDQVWVVTKIDRAITDEAVDTLLLRYGQAYDMAVVCTGIDDHLDPGLALFLTKEGENLNDYKQLSAREKQLGQDIGKLNNLRDRIRAKLATRNLKKRLPADIERELRSRLKNADGKAEHAERELLDVERQAYSALVRARNIYTTRRLREEKNGHLKPGRELDVFCVSNVHYAALKGARIVRGPQLSAAATGIPPLRDFVLRAVAPEVQRTLENFINYRFAVFIRGLAIWANATSVDEGADILRAVRDQKNQVDEIVQQHIDDLIALDNRSNVRPLTKSLSAAKTLALTVMSNKNREWAWVTLKAFVRREGNHQTSIASKQSLNEQFLEGFNQVLRSSWGDFEADHKKVGNHFQVVLEGLVSSIRTMIKGHPASYSLSMQELDGFLEAQKQGIQQACHEYRADDGKELRNIKLDMMQDRETGFFTQAMRQTYTTCSYDSGSGWKARTVQTFMDELSRSGDASPFQKSIDKLSSSITKNAMKKSAAVGTKTEKIFDEIYRQVEFVMKDKTVEPDEKLLRAVLGVQVKTAQRGFNDIKERLEVVKKKYGPAGLLC